MRCNDRTTRAGRRGARCVLGFASTNCTSRGTVLCKVCLVHLRVAKAAPCMGKVPNDGLPVVSTRNLPKALGFQCSSVQAVVVLRDGLLNGTYH